jgi:hypothetical protein
MELVVNNLMIFYLIVAILMLSLSLVVFASRYTDSSSRLKKK